MKLGGKTMNTVVVDASAILEMLVAPEPDPELRRHIRGSELNAPELIIVEVLSVLRRRERRGEVTADQAARSMQWLAQAQIGLLPHRPLVPRAWELRHTVTITDATYVTMAEELGVPLVTTDAKLAGSNGHKAEIELYPAS